MVKLHSLFYYDILTTCKAISLRLQRSFIMSYTCMWTCWQGDKHELHREQWDRVDICRCGLLELTQHWRMGCWLLLWFLFYRYLSKAKVTRKVNMFLAFRYLTNNTKNLWLATQIHFQLFLFFGWKKSAVFGVFLWMCFHVFGNYCIYIGAIGHAQLSQ